MSRWATKWRAFNWDVHEVDGHSLSALVDVFDNLPRDSERPQMIIAHTIKGKGVGYMENSRLWHLGNLAGVDAEATIEEILQNEVG